MPCSTWPRRTKGRGWVRQRGRACPRQARRRATTCPRGGPAGEQARRAATCAAAPPQACPRSGTRCPLQGAPAALQRPCSAWGSSRRCTAGRRQAHTASGPWSGASSTGPKRASRLPASCPPYPSTTCGARHAPVERLPPFVVAGPRVVSRRRRRPPSRRRPTRRRATVSAHVGRSPCGTRLARAASREALSRRGGLSHATPLWASPACASRSAPHIAAHRRTAAAPAGGQRSERPHTTSPASTPAERFPARLWPVRRS
jgi:hypothetical protein